LQLNAPAWNPGGWIRRGRDMLEVVELRYGGEPATLV
jgi:hypothetical protein